MLPSINVSGELNPESLPVLSGLVTALYANRQDVAEATLDAYGGGQIGTWFYDNTNPVCNYFLAQQPGNNMVLIIAGTELWEQMIGNLTGSIGTLYPGSNTAYAHKYFLDQALSIFNAIEPLMPAAPFSLTGCGHSLGAAVLMLVLSFYKTLNLDINLSGLGINMPRALTELGGGFVPTEWTRLRSDLDPVTYLPLPSGVVRANLAEGDIFGVNPSIKWRHFGK